jgi:hypothetical protein
MGTTMFYVLMSMKPEYNAKIRHMVALAPVAFLRNTKSPFASITKLLPNGVSSLTLLCGKKDYNFRLHIF